MEEVAAEVGVKSIRAGAHEHFSPQGWYREAHAVTFPVAIAYVMQKVPYVFPVIGARKTEHLYSNLEALDVALTEEHVVKIEGVVPFDRGFPTNVMVRSMRWGIPG